MTTLRDVVALIAVSLAISSSLSAQWPPYPTPGVPKTPDGKPNLLAPAPKTADGKIELSGLWQNVRNPGRGDPPPPPPPAGTPPVLTFRDIGSGFKEGLPFQPWALELRNKRSKDNSKDNPDALCLPMGLTQFHAHPQPRKIIQTPGLILIIYEANYGLRYIYTDGRPLPNNDPQPWWYGYSVGKWEGDTLVVETTGLRDDGWLDIIGSPSTDKAKIIERFRRPTYGTLEVDVTIDDPKAYTKPFTVRVNQRIMLDSELIEFICAENQQFIKYLGGAKKQ